MKKIQITARTRAPEPITQSVLDKAVERGKMRHNTDKTIRLAEFCDGNVLYQPAAAEIRRLHAENQMLWKEREEPHKTIDMYVRECNRLESERDEARRTVRLAHEAGTRLTDQRDLLLGVLKSTRAFINSVAPHGSLLERVNAAIESVEGVK